MMVIIPHPTEELKLIKLQKTLIEQLNDNSTIYISTIPLWLELQLSNTNTDIKNDLKAIAKKIQSIDILDIKSENDGIYLSYSVRMENTIYKNDFLFLSLYKGKAKDISSVLPFSKIKIFRLGIPEDLSENSKTIIESVWCKL